MRGSADTSGMHDVKSRRAFFRFEIVCQDQPLEIKPESSHDFVHSEMRSARDSFFSMRVECISLAFLSSFSVAPMHGPNSDSRNGVFFAASWHARCRFRKF